MEDGHTHTWTKGSLVLRDIKKEPDTENFDVVHSETDLLSHSMLRGMKGYHLTPEDRDFLQEMLDKMVAKLQAELQEAQKLLQLETRALTKALAQRKQLQEMLQKVPSPAELSRWVLAVLEHTSTSAQVDGLDSAALMALVSARDVRRVVHRKRAQLKSMRKELQQRKKTNADEEMQLQRVFNSKRCEVQALMTELWDLKTQLLQQQATASLQTSGRAERVKSEQPSPPQQNATNQLRRKRKEAREEVTDRKSKRLASRQKTAAALQPGGAEEPQQASLRRSKRIANRR